jgi:hypothetical protein
MRVLENIAYEGVVDFFMREHPINDDSIHFEGNKWGKLHLEQANVSVQGDWSLCELETEEILGIVLPYHAAEHGESILIQEDGLIVRDAIKKLKDNLPEYSEKNPVCWKKMMYWKDKEYSPLFLSTVPAYQGKRSHVNPSLGKIFHLDGLHRLMRWGMDGRFTPDLYNQNPKLTAYIAGVK